MPKDRSVNSLSSHRARVCPYACSSKTTNQGKSKKASTLIEDEKDWEEAKCPICLEHPHNSVLLLCSSRTKGCRPYMCNTSHRHSNCLDQYRKSSTESEDFSRGTHFRERETKLICPLCRGHINGWTVTKPARKYMDLKLRSCSLETCSFIGNYTALRKHARMEHPTIRPTEADPSRRSEWRRLERQTDIDDTLSAYESYGFDLDEDDLLDDINLNIFDILNEMQVEIEAEWSDDDNNMLNCEFELDFTFLNDIFDDPDERRVRNQRLGSSSANNGNGRRWTRSDVRRRNVNQFRGPLDGNI